MSQIAQCEAYLISEHNKALTAIRTVVGLAVRIVRFEIAAIQPVAIRIVANRKPRFKTSNVKVLFVEETLQMVILRTFRPVASRKHV